MLHPFTTFINLMEQTKRQTISLVLSMVYKMLMLLDPITFVTVVDYETDSESQIIGENMHPVVERVQSKLSSEIRRRFITEEREGHEEDLLISTILDPRFKHFCFPGATQDMRQKAVRYLRAAYEADWSPEAKAAAEKGMPDERQSPVSTQIDVILLHKVNLLITSFRYRSRNWRTKKWHRLRLRRGRLWG